LIVILVCILFLKAASTQAADGELLLFIVFWSG